ncbi:aminotransferase class IV-domain-containing protein [Aspergillus foveolatus]|uniref:aminotransferase class IV-domain-containing protein n=1 Tax=Aspergillus foveolatus TaxID=210207 RepID=UPI003CCDA2B1
MSSQSFEIISTLRYDPSLPTVVRQRLGNTHTYPDPLLSPYYLLPYHQDRLRSAARYFNWDKASEFLEQDLTQFAQYLDTFIPQKEQCWRIRIVVDQNGSCKVETSPAAHIELESFLVPFIISPTSTPWRVYVDTAYTTPSGLTTHKTTAREDYASARARAGITTPQDTAEVLLVNPQGEIMEGSITTPYFQRRGPTKRDVPAWITPPLSSGGNAGTSRRYALNQGFCTEEVITTRDLVDGEVCLLSNGVRGFILGQIVLEQKEPYIPCEPVVMQSPLPPINMNVHATATMKFFENLYTYDYSFPAVSLAYFLRYPNPYSRHVLTTDVIDRYVDPTTHRLHTTRIHLKKSKVPSGILKLLPKGIGGSDNSGQSYILETTVVDVKEGWMESESRNMEWTGILSVVERQVYRRQPLEGSQEKLDGLLLDDKRTERTTVNTTVTFRSRFGQGKLLGRRKTEDLTGDYEEEAPKRGFFTSLSTAGIQRTIELIGLNRTRDAILKSKQGMNVVLERLRSGGIVGVLDGMRQDREAIAVGTEGPWKRVWLAGNSDNDD